MFETMFTENAGLGTIGDYSTDQRGIYRSAASVIGCQYSRHLSPKWSHYRRNCSNFHSLLFSVSICKEEKGKKLKEPLEWKSGQI